MAVQVSLSETACPPLCITRHALARAERNSAIEASVVAASTLRSGRYSEKCCHVRVRCQRADSSCGCRMRRHDKGPDRCLLFVVKNALKRLAFTSSFMPIPVSLTAILRYAPAAREFALEEEFFVGSDSTHRGTSVPPSGIACSAFKLRLSRHCNSV